ncbi:hypothetical protein T06_9287 [Trichinella sp. T6]|nr:hypothetical protein T06_9287 [Trichinella sp. T6]
MRIELSPSKAEEFLMFSLLDEDEERYEAHDANSFS